MALESKPIEYEGHDRAHSVTARARSQNAVQAAVEREKALGTAPDDIKTLKADVTAMKARWATLHGENGIEVAGDIVRLTAPPGGLAAEPLPTVMAYAAVNGRIELVRLTAQVVPHDRP